MTDKQPEALRLACSSHCTNLRNELRNANADVKRFREAASCERDVRLELEKQVSTLQAEVRRLNEENDAKDALLRQALECMTTSGMGYGVDYQAWWKRLENTIAALRERLK